MGIDWIDRASKIFVILAVGWLLGYMHHFWATRPIQQELSSRIDSLEAQIGGCSFVRIDVPEVEGSQAITKFYGNGAIYSMTPVSEELVRTFVKRYKPAPLNVYMPEIQQVPYQEEMEYEEGM